MTKLSPNSGHNFKSKIFPTTNPDKIPTPETAPEPTMVIDTHETTKGRTKISHLSCMNFLNKILNDEKNIKSKIFREYFKYHLTKDLLKTNLAKNEQRVN